MLRLNLSCKNFFMLVLNFKSFTQVLKENGDF